MPRRLRISLVMVPGTILRGKVSIGEDCVIGPNSLLEDSAVGSHVKLNAVQCYQSQIEDGVTAGTTAFYSAYSSTLP